MATNDKAVRQEYFDNEGTNVEIETVTDETRPEEPKPWDPDKIRIHTKPYSLRQINDMIADQDIDLAPDFQRFYVWKTRQKSRLIESILLGIPMPSFYFTEDKDGKLQVVDGLQRLSTIYGFARKNDFTLDDVEYLDELRGFRYDQLPQVFRRRFDGTQIFANVIDPQTPYPVKFDVFKRINTAGSPLNAQEIRHCMSTPKARTFLKQFADNEAFHIATGFALRNHIRMADREVALRFCAFRKLGVKEYKKFESFDSFLGEMLDHLNRMSTKEVKYLLGEFERAMKLAHALFGEHAFRKWPKGVTSRNPINRALFEIWAVVLTQHQEKHILPLKKKIVDRARDAMTRDDKFLAAISQGTGDTRKVEYRFNKVAKIVEEAQK